MRQFSGSVEEVLVRSMVTCSSRYIDSASPITSKPGPMLAEELGVRITKDSIVLSTDKVYVGNEGWKD